VGTNYNLVEESQTEAEDRNDCNVSDTDCIMRDDETQTVQLRFGSDSEDESSEVGRKSNLALNEVFIGESHAARVSYYDVQLDDGPLIKQKSSGMTICTGTGSTSWHYNINRLTEQHLSEIFGILNKKMCFNFDREINGNVLEEACRLYNEELVFAPEEQKMAFSVRDPVFNATFPKTVSRGFVQKIRLKSRCFHAHLILDGSTSIPFNRGAEVLLEIHPEDAIRTAILN